MTMTIVEAVPGVTGGVDTHLDKHVAAALDPLGRLVGTESFSADSAGYKALFAWLEGFGEVTKVGVEGTGAYGVGVARFLRRRGIEVVEVNRPNRQARRNHGKVRSARCGRSRSSCALGSGVWCGKDQGRPRRGHPGARGGQALGPRGPDQGDYPDAPPRLHRP
jgi:Transposase